jgi:16S rRNA (guanine(527)-N(7))-methyltransferase RsmG
MGAELPPFDPELFAKRIAENSRNDVDDDACSRLYAHYEELRRWNARLSLIGPGTAGSIFERHYGESLAAISLLDPGDRTLVDIGSGAGFPGLVLAAVRPELEVILIESRERKGSFLRSAIRRMGLRQARVENARISAQGDLIARLGVVDVVTSRAVALEEDVLAALIARSPHARFLLWEAQKEAGSGAGYRRTREVALSGANHRRVVEYRSDGNDSN